MYLQFHQLFDTPRNGKHKSNCLNGFSDIASCNLPKYTQFAQYNIGGSEEKSNQCVVL